MGQEHELGSQIYGFKCWFCYIVPMWLQASSLSSFKSVHSHRGRPNLSRSLRRLNDGVTSSAGQVLPRGKSLPNINLYCYTAPLSPSPCHPTTRSVNSILSMSLESVPSFLSPRPPSWSSHLSSITWWRQKLPNQSSGLHSCPLSILSPYFYCSFFWKPTPLLSTSCWAELLSVPQMDRALLSLHKCCFLCWGLWSL